MGPCRRLLLFCAGKSASPADEIKEWNPCILSQPEACNQGAPNSLAPWLPEISMEDQQQHERFLGALEAAYAAGRKQVEDGELGTTSWVYHNPSFSEEVRSSKTKPLTASRKEVKDITFISMWGPHGIKLEEFCNHMNDGLTFSDSICSSPLMKNWSFQFLRHFACRWMIESCSCQLMSDIILIQVRAA